VILYRLVIEMYCYIVAQVFPGTFLAAVAAKCIVFQLHLTFSRHFQRNGN